MHGIRQTSTLTCGTEEKGVTHEARKAYLESQGDCFHHTV